MPGQAAQSETAISFSPRRLGHANLWVGDVDRNTAFYNEIFGLHLEATEPGILGSFLGNGNSHHDIGTVQITRGEDRVGRDGQILIPKEISGRTGLFHLGWEMRTEAELVRAIGRLRQTGHPITMFADHQITHSIYIPDPDGHLHEFYADALKDWRAIFRGEMGLITGDWDPDKEPPAEDIRFEPEPELYGVDTAPLRPLRITHAGLVVADLDRSVRWYTEVAGLTLARDDRQGGYATFTGSLGRHDLALFQAAAGESPSLHHIGFELENEAALERSKTALQARGIQLEKEVDTAGKRSLFLLDPDGMRWEFSVQRQSGRESPAEATAAERRYLV